ncbi:MAG TPA: DsrE family protein [Verrucomicrobiae bacterium]|jgi:predicted peroxiredoxin
MPLRGKKLCVLLSAPPDRKGFQHGLGVAEAALIAGVEVYFYCIDEGVQSLAEPRLQALVLRGLKLYGCAYSARLRRLPIDDKSNWAGLALLSDLIAATDKMVAFS